MCKIKQMTVHILEIMLVKITMRIKVGAQLLQKIKAAVLLGDITECLQSSRFVPIHFQRLFQ